MSTNNFAQIRTILTFPDKHSFYFLQLIRRKKDNPDLGKDMRVIAEYFIYSLDQFNRMESEIIMKCDNENARAYLRVNRRDAKKLAIKAAKLIMDYIDEGNYNSAKSAYASVTGKYHADPDKKWIVDLDDDKIPEGFAKQDWLDDVTEFVKSLIEKTKRDPTILTLPTKNGTHLICRPFNKKEFKAIYPNIDIQPENPTLIYCP